MGDFVASEHLLPAPGGIMTALQVLFVVVVVVALLWSQLDPRPGWAVAVLATRATKRVVGR
jgi:hypothetical protein